MIHVTGLCHQFGYERVLVDLNLTVPARGRVAVVGRNGAGKTTLLRILAGLLRPASGQVRITGKLGWLGEKDGIYPELTARQNIEFWSGVTRGSAGRGMEILDYLQVGDSRPVKTWSKGMRRKLGLACALAHSPEIVLLDEPFAGIDADSTTLVTNILTSIDAALVVATHRSETRFCDHVLTMQDGRLH